MHTYRYSNSLSSGDHVHAVIEELVVPTSRLRFLRPTFAVGVLVPLGSNPPFRSLFDAQRFRAFESFLVDLVGGYSRPNGTVAGAWKSEFFGRVDDQTALYVIGTPTLEAADDLTGHVYRYVAEHFEQEHVLIRVRREYSTLVTTKEEIVAAVAA